jgi:hypothetical protein
MELLAPHLEIDVSGLAQPAISGQQKNMKKHTVKLKAEN